jgi:hypothetical protein
MTRTVPHAAVIDLFRLILGVGQKSEPRQFDRGHLLGRDEGLVTSSLPSDDIASFDWLP